MAGYKTDTGRARRAKLYETIRDSYAANGYPPRTTDLAKATGMAHTTMLWHMRSLREQGFLTFTDGDITRTLRPVTRRKDPKDIK